VLSTIDLNKRIEGITIIFHLEFILHLRRRPFPQCIVYEVFLCLSAEKKELQFGAAGPLFTALVLCFSACFVCLSRVFCHASYVLLRNV